jgi:hypothetical protein
MLVLGILGVIPRHRSSMKTAIGYPTYYTLVCRRESVKSGSMTPLHLHRGCYADIRDAMQIMVNLTLRYPNIALIFMIESSDRRPIGWIHPSKYNQGRCQE